MGQPAYCGVISASGRYGEQIACAYPPGHVGAHSWASLPTFTRPVHSDEAENKRAVERIREILKYALSEEDMAIQVSCGWDGDTKASVPVPTDVARWLTDWCQDTLDCWSQPG